MPSQQQQYRVQRMASIQTAAHYGRPHPSRPVFHSQQQQQQQRQQQQQQQQQQESYHPPPSSASSSISSASASTSTSVSLTASHSMPPSLPMQYGGLNNSVVDPSPANRDKIIMTPATLWSSPPSAARPPRKTTGLATSQAVLKLMEFSDRLSPQANVATHRQEWDRFVDDFFLKPRSRFNFTLYNIETEEKREYTLSEATVARFFQTQYKSGAVALQLILEQTNEYFLPDGMLLECPRSSLIYRYESGNLTVMSGVLFVVLKLDCDNLKIERFDFECTNHDDFISRTSLNRKRKAKKRPILESPVTEWGIPSDVLDVLELADAATRLEDLIMSSVSMGKPPQDLLSEESTYSASNAHYSTTMQQQQQQPVPPQHQKFGTADTPQYMLTPSPSAAGAIPPQYRARYPGANMKQAPMASPLRYSTAGPGTASTDQI